MGTHSKLKAVRQVKVEMRLRYLVAILFITTLCLPPFVYDVEALSAEENLDVNAENLTHSSKLSLPFGSIPSAELLPCTLYVAPTGSDSNPGTQAAPFKSIQKAAEVVDQVTSFVSPMGFTGKMV